MVTSTTARSAFEPSCLSRRTSSLTPADGQPAPQHAASCEILARRSRDAHARPQASDIRSGSECAGRRPVVASAPRKAVAVAMQSMGWMSVRMHEVSEHRWRDHDRWPNA
jgi:hypothetical protein